MGYDLEFRTTKPVKREDTTRWLAAQPFATATEDQVDFENRATGVHFTFDFLEGEALPSFRIPYGRPHYFGLETSYFLESFTREFALEVSDPQRHGMGDGPYVREAFVRGWEAGNDWAHCTFVKDHPEQPDYNSVPRDVNDWLWRWNYACVHYDLMHVILVKMPSGEISTCLIWDAPGRLVFPEGVNRIATMHRKKAHVCDPETLLRVIGGGQASSGLPNTVKRKGVEVVRGIECAASYSVAEPTPKRKIELLTCSPATKLQQLPFASVLDRELVIEARRLATK